MGNSIHVERTYCLFWQREMCELWDGLYPVIPANNYLRSNLVLSNHTLADKAYSLVLFFRFLQRNSIEFFELNTRTLNPFILLFKNELLLRARSRESSSDERDSTRAEPVVKPISYPRAQSVMAEVGWLCEWWGLIETRPSRSLSHHGKTHPSNSYRTPKRVLPECFRINIPEVQRRFSENHVLEPSEVEAIWIYLTSEARPNFMDIYC